MQPNNQPISKSRRVLGNGLIFFAGLGLAGSAAAKFARVPKVVGELGAMGFDGHWLMLIAVLEILSAGLFLMRSTRAFGLLMVSAFLGGAIATHIQHGHSPAQPVFFLSVLWLGAWLRHPEILWSLRALDTKQVASPQQKNASAI
jgi:hypothetical protein